VAHFLSPAPLLWAPKRHCQAPCHSHPCALPLKKLPRPLSPSPLLTGLASLVLPCLGGLNTSGIPPLHADQHPNTCRDLLALLRSDLCQDRPSRIADVHVQMLRSLAAAMEACLRSELLASPAI
jgi:hypothetical protein